MIFEIGNFGNFEISVAVNKNNLSIGLEALAWNLSSESAKWYSFQVHLGCLARIRFEVDYFKPTDEDESYTTAGFPIREMDYNDATVAEARAEEGEAARQGCETVKL